MFSDVGQLLEPTHSPEELENVWFKLLCEYKGSWKTPSIQFLRLDTAESCWLSAKSESKWHSAEDDLTPRPLCMHDG